MSALTVDHEQIATFVNALFRYADDGGFVQLRAFRDDANRTWGSWPVVQINGAGLDPVIESAIAFAQECADATVPVVFCPPIVTLSGARSAAQENIANGLVLSVECDERPAYARQHLEQLLGPATIITASGGVWVDPDTGEAEPRLHIHWRLTEASRTEADHLRLKEARRVAQILAGADGTAVPLVHPMRWPGSWHRKRAPRLAQIIAVHDDAEIELSDAYEVLCDAADAAGVAQQQGPRVAGEPSAEARDIAAAFEVIPNDDRRWEDWNRLGMAAWAATAGSEDGFAAFASWSAKSRKHDIAACRERWGHYPTSPPDHIGFGTLVFEARAACPGWRKPSADFVASGDPFVDYSNGLPPGGSGAQAGKDEGEDFSQSAQSQRPRPVIFNAGLDDAPIPPRGWLLGTAFCRRFLSSLLGSGGTGKTAVRIAQALAMATGRPLTGEYVFVRCRVLFICLEDDIDELRRRVRAAMLHYRITKADIEGWLFYAAPGRTGGKLVERAGNQLKLGWMAEWLVDEIKRLKIDAIIIDPLIKAHNAAENSNDEMDMVSDVLAQIAHEHDCAVDTPHHVRKGPGDPGNADLGRGAGATKDGGRLVYTLTPMAEDEARRFNVTLESRRRFMRVDYGKVNLVPAADAKWFELIGVRIGNQNATYPNGDEVQVAVHWSPPETWEGLSSEALNAALTDIDAGTDRGERYSGTPSAKDRAAWRVVQRHCPEKNEPQCREIIRAWLKTGLLFEEKYDDPVQRKTLSGLRVDETKRPS